jgi:hypothetical protein
VNATAMTALDAGRSYTESLERASATEKRLSENLGKLGRKIGTPINAASKDAAARVSSTLKDIRSQMIK